MDIKKDLDNELEKRISERQEDKESYKLRNETKKRKLDSYLTESNIIETLEEVVNWSKEKGKEESRSIPQYRTSSERKEFTHTTTKYYNFYFYVKEKVLIFPDRRFITLICSDDLEWTLILHNPKSNNKSDYWNPNTSTTRDLKEDEMLEQYKKIFIRLVDSTSFY